MSQPSSVFVYDELLIHWCIAGTKNKRPLMQQLFHHYFAVELDSSIVPEEWTLELPPVRHLISLYSTSFDIIILSLARARSLSLSLSLSRNDLSLSLSRKSISWNSRDLI